MSACPECHRTDDHKFGCSRRLGRQAVLPTSAVTDIDLTEAIAAAHTATCRVPGCTASYDATVMVRAALPHIAHQVRMQVTRERLADAFEAEAAAPTDERQVREQVAREIEAEAGAYPSPWRRGMLGAARIARGGAS